MKNLVLFFAVLFLLFAFGLPNDAVARDRNQQIIVNVNGMHLVYSDRDYNRGPRYDRRYNRSDRNRYNRSHRSSRGWDDSRRSYDYRSYNRGGCYNNCGQQRSHYRAEPWQRYYHQPPRFGPPPSHRHSRQCGHRW